MDDETQSTKSEVSGAPELGKGVKPPSAPLVNDRQTGPVFRAEPTMPAEQPVSIDTTPAPDLFDGDDDDAPEAPPALDEHQARIEYLQSLRQEKPKKRGKTSVGRVLLAMGLILVIIGALGAAGYFFFHSSRPTAKKVAVTPAATNQQPTQQQTTPTTTTPTTPTDATASAEPKDYTSTTFNLNLSYPGNWTPEELTDKLAITSPVVSLTDASGQVTKGRIVLSVRKQQAKPAEFTAGNVVAVLDSVKVNYTKPAASQRASTYLSYLQYAGTNVKGGLDGIYITGNYAYKYKQTAPVTEVSKISPLVSVAFVSCADDTCAATTQKPIAISSTAWNTDTTNRPAVETMLKSFIFN